MNGFKLHAELQAKWPFLRVLSAIVLAVCAANANALEFQFRKISDGGLIGPGKGLDCRALVPDQECVEIIAEGKIESGDNERLVAFIESTESSLAEWLGKPVRVGKIFLDSPGGELGEAISIGRTLRKRMISAQVAINSVCHSACVVALAGAVFRLTYGPIGVHAFYSEDFIGPNEFGRRSEQYNLFAKHLEDYVREMRISNKFMDLINQTPPAMLKILDSQQLLDSGLAGVDPVYHGMVRRLSDQEHAQN